MCVCTYIGSKGSVSIYVYISMYIQSMWLAIQKSFHIKHKRKLLITLSLLGINSYIVHKIPIYNVVIYGRTLLLFSAGLAYEHVTVFSSRTSKSVYIERQNCRSLGSTHFPFC